MTFLSGGISTAQVKIGDNANVTQPSAMLELESTNKALVIPRVASTAAIATPVNGMLIFDLSVNCIKGYQNSAWSGCLNSSALSLNIDDTFSGDCANAVRIQSPAGYLQNGQTYTGSYTVPYYSGDGTAYGATSQTLSGLTLTRAAGSYTGTGTVIYTLSGTYTGTTNMPVVFSVPECGALVYGDDVADNFTIGNDQNAFSTSHAICSTGEVSTQGRNNEGQLGAADFSGNMLQFVDNNGTPQYSTFKTSVFTPTYDAIAVDQGGRTSLYLGQDGQVWASGTNNNFGMLGQNAANTPATSYPPIKVLGAGGTGFLTGMFKIESGANSNFAIRGSDGAVFGWGYNNAGQLGDGTVTTRFAPVQTVGVGGTGFLTGIIDVSTVAENRNVNATHTCGVKNDGTAYCWGSNVYAALGNGTTTNSNTPIQVVGVGGVGFLTNVKDITSHTFVTVAVKNDGTVWAWGNDNSGGLGQNTAANVNQTTPVQVKGVGGVGFLTNIVQIDNYQIGFVALRSDGTVYTWGNGDNGQNGDGSTSQRNAPVQVKGVGGTGVLSNIVAIKAGAYGVLALASDGKLYGWGLNQTNSLAPATNGAIINTPILLSNYCLVR
ncbi:hypothetical protein N0B16_03415 [Chryseobacterium sp. GMJ5]|uniref:Uncharacterized protein n=1 Tax=Chryseobacterium gilvum TaxID=2976534 RepID=A0ABT2VYB1_9FLAO|nr:hypothetical protein [Chryseobacterium gilvum]MCU7613475.1 hypothetical protein [Chryseobacterium gilvum]